jgi:hypothetical protein
MSCSRFAAFLLTIKKATWCMRARRDALLEAAFLEFRSARQVSTGNGEAHLARWRHSEPWSGDPETGRYPDFLVEVGRKGDADPCGPGCRCSIDMQARRVREDNVARVREFKAKDEGPIIVSRTVRNAAVDRQRKRKRQSSVERMRHVRATFSH